MSMIQALAGLIGGLVFGLFLFWGMLSPIIIIVGVAIMLIGAVMPTSFRWLFGSALMGFLIAFIAGAGMEML